MTTTLTSAFPTVQVGERTLSLCFINIFRRWTETEKEAMRESVQLDGFEDDIVIDQHGRVLDGNNRLLLWEELGLNPEVLTLREEFTTSDEDAVRKCLAINVRNQLGRRENDDDRRRRAEFVVAQWPDLVTSELMILSGCSRKMIEAARQAVAEKCDQVADNSSAALTSPSENGEQPAVQPESNGQAQTEGEKKEKPQRRKSKRGTVPVDPEKQKQTIMAELRRLKEAGAEVVISRIAKELGCSRNTVQKAKEEFERLPVGDDPLETAPKVLDELGYQVPMTLQPVFAMREKIDSALQKSKDITAVLSDMDVLENPHQHEYVHESKNLYQNLTNLRPHAVCPACAGTGLIRTTCCTECRLGLASKKGKGWLTEKGYKATAQKLRS